MVVKGTILLTLFLAFPLFHMFSMRELDLLFNLAWGSVNFSLSLLQNQIEQKKKQLSLSSLASPKITLVDPAPIVRPYPEDKLWCSATGPLPIYVALIMNSTVLANATNTAGITLYEEGNYSCVATNKYGTVKRVIPIIFIGEALHLKG